MNELGRFVIRPGDGKKCLVLGLVLETEFLKPNTIYSIREINDELSIIEMGESKIVNPGPGCESSLNWGRTVNDIINQGHFCWTKEEYDRYYADKHHNADNRD